MPISANEILQLRKEVRPCHFGMRIHAILFIAIINFTNLSTARSANRAKEVGVRKVVGASRWHRAALTKKFEKTTRGVNPSSNWVVFRSDPSPEDLFQGGLGDCYFISALACVAQRPTLIKHLFVGLGYQDLYRTHSPHGVYQIRLCKDGYWTARGFHLFSATPRVLRCFICCN